MNTAKTPLILALPKGRILQQIMPLLASVGIEPEAGFYAEDDRRLRFATSVDGLEIIRVRSFDVATFIAYGAAHIGVSGSDVLMEFDHPEICAPIDLNVGQCRMVVAKARQSWLKQKIHACMVLMGCGRYNQHIRM